MCSKRVLAALAATLLLGIAAGSAAANRLSVSERSFRMTWTPLRIGTFESTLWECNLTLEGSFHSSIFVKTRGLLLGSITRAAISGCEVTLLTATLPWHVIYRSFSGLLPRISNIRIAFAGVSFSYALGLCLIRVRTESPLNFIAKLNAEGVITELPADEAEALPAGCGYEFLTYQGIGRVTGAGGSRVRITLV
jgi:hypothetical protein